jgi:hypothetical protein
MKQRILFILLFSVLLPSIIRSQNISPPVSDLDALHQTLVQNHPKLICGKDREMFDSLYRNIRIKYSDISRNQKIFEMTKLVASIHDGHTKVGIDFDTTTHFHKLPLRLYIYEDGVFIRRIDNKDSMYVGMKVLKIGSLQTDTLIKKILPYIHGENESAVKDILPSRLVITELLNYLGAASSVESVSLLLEDSLHKTFTVSFKPVVMDANINWFSARDTKEAPPLYLSNPNKNYWFTYIDSMQIIYFQFNVVQDMEDISFEKFVDSMFTKINSLPVNKMVIDIRNNNGGDNTLNKYLIHALIRSDKINQKGKLFVIIGRLTFSAAVNLTADLESNTNAIFVGESTAAGPNHYGETKVLRLPESHLIVLYSSQYWQSSFPWDKRTSIDPSISIKITSKDFRNNNDPCLNAIEQ